ncbi:MAG: YggS family pyridoxal phosphate enzyme [Candidatus Melainabacteria bacterium LEY3_CP_29_8]|nr:MAG: YggS family pyridoxal phosphate enzyme [Candidatus Melainabacteria bacterium LEY3_CP_29_8]
MGNIKENLKQIRQQLAHSQVKIIAVTKYYGVDRLIEAYNFGLRDFGENKVVDAINKIESLPQNIRNESKFHLIGHLQSNKVKKAVKYFDIIHSVDSLKLAQKIDVEAKAINKCQKILLQVNYANEESKTGFSVEELNKTYPIIRNLQNIKIEGLMTMAPKSMNVYALFDGVKKLKFELNSKYKDSLYELSMGMSQDYIEAIKCGSTMIRLGKRIFD